MEVKLGEFPLVITNPILCSGWERVHPIVASRSSARGWVTPEELGAAVSAGAEPSPMAQGKEMPWATCAALSTFSSSPCLRQNYFP